METLCKIREIYREISEFETSFQKLYNLCLNEGMLLCTLSRYGQLSSGKIAEELGLTTSNASKVIKSAEAKSLIERVIGKTDKRQMYFLLTKEGEQKLRSIKCETIGIPEILKAFINSEKE